MSYFGENVANMCKVTGKTRRDMEHDLNIPYATISKWIRSGSEPNEETMMLVTNYFNKTLFEMKSKLIPTIKDESLKICDYKMFYPPNDYTDSKEYLYYMKNDELLLLEKFNEDNYDKNISLKVLLHDKKREQVISGLLLIVKDMVTHILFNDNELISLESGQFETDDMKIIGIKKLKVIQDV